jgi:hypothetical protein
MEGENIKGVSVGTWIALVGMVLNLGFTYGVLDSKTKVLEAQIQSYEVASQKDREEQKSILKTLTEQQRNIDKNSQELNHIRELRNLEKQIANK